MTHTHVMMVEGNPLFGKGLWTRTKVNDVTIVRVSCPGCGLAAALDHEIDDDGIVNPSLQCPTCGYHDWIKLGGWSGGGSA